MRYLIPLAVIVLLIIYFFVTGGDDTSEIERVFDGMIESAREKDQEGLLGHFSIHYQDEHGYNYLVIKKVIENAFQEYDSLDGSYGDISVTFSEDENGEKLAHTKVGVRASGVKGGIPETLLGSEDSFDDVVVTLKKSAFGGWKIIEVEGVDKYGNEGIH